MDILSFAAETGLTLSPVQRVVVKLITGMPLDSERQVAVRQLRVHSTRHLHETRTETTETEYVADLEVRGRYKPATTTTNPRKVLLLFGRRSSKTTLGGLVLAHDVVRRLNKPAEIYGAETFALTAYSKRYAEDIFRSLSEMALRCSRLKERAAHFNKEGMTFQTEEDIQRSGTWVGSRRQADASLHINVLAALPTALRGRNIRSILLDEVNALPRASVYDTVQTALAGTYSLNGRAVLTGSTDHSDFVRELWDEWSADPKALCLRIPTWELMPQIPQAEFRDCLQRQGVASFLSEFGAEFVRSMDIPIPMDEDTALQDFQSYVHSAVHELMESKR